MIGRAMLGLFVDYERGDGDERVGACTVVGPRDEVRAFVDELKEKGLIKEEQIKPLAR